MPRLWPSPQVGVMPYRPVRLTSFMTVWPGRNIGRLCPDAANFAGERQLADGLGPDAAPLHFGEADRNRAAVVGLAGIDGYVIHAHGVLLGHG